MYRWSLRDIVSAVNKYVFHEALTWYKDGSQRRGFLQLAKSFVAQEEEGFVFLYRTADRHAVLAHAKRKDGGHGQIARGIWSELIKFSRIEYGISQIAKSRSVEIVRSGLGNDVNLSACLRPVF